MSRLDAASVNITGMLREWGSGSREALDEVLPFIYGELRRQAARCLRREYRNNSLGATALVHETYLKLLKTADVDLENRSHFFAIAATAMRRILVDHARYHDREKRGGRAEDLPLEEAVVAAEGPADVDLIALDEALHRLARIDPQQETLVELRYFCGLSLEESAAALGVSRATAAREWSVAKTWLYREMTRGGV
jgi:RNA polymerase sigma factor (TIGR02999 family)